MPSLVDRWYGTTIPEHVAPAHPLAPHVGVVTLEVTSEWDWRRGVLIVRVDGGRFFRDSVERIPIPRALIEAKQAELRTNVMRACAGSRRRQGRRGR